MIMESQFTVHNTIIKQHYFYITFFSKQKNTIAIKRGAISGNIFKNITCDDNSVSREHGFILFCDNNFIIYDNKSTYGTLKLVSGVKGVETLYKYSELLCGQQEI